VQFLEERRVEIQRAVTGTIERAHRRARLPAGRPHAAAKQHELRRLVARAAGLEYGGPDIFGVAQHATAERGVLIFRLRLRGRRRPGRRLRAVAGSGRSLLRRRSATAEQAEYFQGVDAEDQAADDDQDQRADA
jgi:hypothetical protein